MKKHIRILIAVLLLGMVICLIVRIRYINQRFPQESISETEYGEAGLLGTDITMTVVDQEWISFEEAEVEPGEEGSNQGYYYLIKVRLQNTGDQAQEADLTQIYLDYEGFATGIEYNQYRWRNEIESIHPTLQDQETVEVILPYAISDIQWKKKDWMRIQEIPFCLMLEKYPKIQKWQLSLSGV